MTALRTQHEQELREEKQIRQMHFKEIKEREAKFNKAVDAIR